MIKMMDWAIPILAVVVVVGFVLIFFIIIKGAITKKKKFKELATQWGFSYEEKPGLEIYSGFDHPFFEGKNPGLGISGKVSIANHVIKGNKNGFYWEISDFTTKQSGLFGGFSRNAIIHNTSSAYHQTIFVLDIGKQLTPFRIERANFISSLNPDKMIKTVDFHEDPEFNKKYHVYGSDKGAIKNAFSENIRSFFKNNKVDYDIVTNGSKIMFFKKSLRVSPKHLETKMQEILEVAKVFS